MCNAAYKVYLITTARLSPSILTYNGGSQYFTLGALECEAHYKLILFYKAGQLSIRVKASLSKCGF